MRPPVSSAWMHGRGSNTLARGVQSQFEVVRALILRETRTRFGVYQLGYLWAFIEPVLWIGTFFVLFWVVNREAPFGMDIVSFMTTGIVPFLMFRETTQRAASAVDGNKALLYYPQVRPLDLIFARTALEFSTFAVVFFVLLTANGVVVGELRGESLSQTIAALMLASALGFGLGLMLCALRVFWPSTAQLVSPLLRPLFWTSGLFYTANSLPSRARELLLWNPLFHIVELVRDGWFPNYTSNHASPGYVMAWILGLALLGLTLERVARRSIEAA